MFLNQPIKKAQKHIANSKSEESNFSSLPQHIHPSVRQSDDLTLERQVLKPCGSLDHDGKSWTPKRDFWHDANRSQPLFTSTCQSLQFFEETIAGARLKRTIVSKNNINQSTWRHKQIYLNSNTSLEVSWNELKSSDFEKIVNTPITSFRVSPLQFSHVISKSRLQIISAKEQLKPWLKGTG